jgi:hypothetical protein
VEEQGDSIEPTTSRITSWVERGLRFTDDLGVIGKLATIPALLIIVLIPTNISRAIDNQLDPGAIVEETAFHTIPLTLAIGLTFALVCKGVFKNVLQIIAFFSFALLIGASAADYFGCPDCGGTALIYSAQQTVQTWMPEWFTHNAGVLNFIPFILAAIIEYFKKYALGKFLASIVCGLFVGFALIWLFRPLPNKPHS